MMSFITGLILGAVASASALVAWKAYADKKAAAAADKATAKPVGGGGPGEEK